VLTWILAVAAQSLALGYAAGRLRPGRRLFDWAYSVAISGHKPRTPGRLAAEAVAAVMVLAALVAHPRRTVRNIRSWRSPEQRASAPEMDPDWSTQ
jgi:hypothetical protein